MNSIWIVGGLLVAYYLFAYLWQKAYNEIYLNVAQAIVDATKCEILFDQIEDGTFDPANGEFFDLEFMDLSKEPVTWWYAIWLFDFYARQIIMEHSTHYMQVLVPEDGV